MPTNEYSSLLGDIAAPLIPGTNQRKFVSDFTNTEYFKFYNSLINNKQLLNEMKKYGYHGIFYNHPNFAKQEAGIFLLSKYILSSEDYQVK